MSNEAATIILIICYFVIHAVSTAWLSSKINAVQKASDTAHKMILARLDRIDKRLDQWETVNPPDTP